MKKYITTGLMAACLMGMSFSSAIAEEDCTQLASDLSSAQYAISYAQGDLSDLQQQLTDLVFFMDFGQMTAVLEDRCARLPEGFDNECRIEGEQEYIDQKNDLESQISDLGIVVSTYQGTIANLQERMEENNCPV